MKIGGKLDYLNGGDCQDSFKALLTTKSADLEHFDLQKVQVRQGDRVADRQGLI